MKKVILGAFALLASISLASCGNKSNDPDTPEVNGLQVTVLMPDNTPATGVQVQWCEKVCKLPVAVDANGIAVLENYDAGVNYNVHVLRVPEGYTYNPYELVQSDSNKNASISLIKLDSVTSGEGTIASPYMINTGMFSVTLAKNEFKYYAITPNQAGKLVFESFAESTYDPSIGYFGELPNPSYQKLYSDNDGNEYNFKYEFEVSADSVSQSKTYVFGINAKSAAEFSFKVSFK